MHPTMHRVECSPDHLMLDWVANRLHLELMAASGTPPGQNGRARYGEVKSRVHAAQAAGNDTLVSAFHAGETRAREVATPARISGLVVPIDLDATRALAAVRDSAGDAHVVEDEWVWEAQAQLAQREGLYVEPAGAVALAGFINAARCGQIAPGDRVVCLLTGHGFKDDGAARRMVEQSRGGDFVLSAEEIDSTLLDRLPAVR